MDTIQIGSNPSKNNVSKPLIAPSLGISVANLTLDYYYNENWNVRLRVTSINNTISGSCNFSVRTIIAGSLVSLFPTPFTLSFNLGSVTSNPSVIDTYFYQTAESSQALFVELNLVSTELGYTKTL